MPMGSQSLLHVLNLHMITRGYAMLRDASNLCCFANQ